MNLPSFTCGNCKQVNPGFHSNLKTVQQGEDVGGLNVPFMIQTIEVGCRNCGEHKLLRAYE